MVDDLYSWLPELEMYLGGVADDDPEAMKDYKITMASETGSERCPVIIREASGTVSVTTCGETKTYEYFPVEVNISAGETVIQGGVKNLRCSGNNLTALDISQCKSLKTLDCYNNKLTELDLIDNRGLCRLDCSRNNLKELHTVLCPGMCHLNVKKNDFTSKNLDEIVIGLTKGNTRNGILKYYENGAVLSERGQNAVSILIQRGWTAEILNSGGGGESEKPDDPDAPDTPPPVSVNGAKYYKCASVDFTAKTWTGYSLLFDAGNCVIFSDVETTGLTYSVFTPAVGEIWSEDAMLQIAQYSTPITYPVDFAFDIPLESTYRNGETVYLESSVSGYCPANTYLEFNKELAGVKCLYMKDRVGNTVWVQIGGALFAKDDTTANESTGCSARYGAGHPWTYSFWFYPNSTTNVGAGEIFTLGYCYNSGYNRRLRCSYNDNDGTFRLLSDQNDGLSSDWMGYAEKGRWHHICITAESNSREFKLYLNGGYILSFAHPSQNIPQNGYTKPTFYIGGTTRCPGSAGDSALQHATGGFAKLKWYNRVLDTGEIVALSQEIKTA